MRTLAETFECAERYVVRKQSECHSMPTIEFREACLQQLPSSFRVACGKERPTKCDYTCSINFSQELMDCMTAQSKWRAKRLRTSSDSRPPVEPIRPVEAINPQLTYPLPAWDGARPAMPVDYRKNTLGSAQGVFQAVSPSVYLVMAASSDEELEKGIGNLDSTFQLKNTQNLNFAIAAEEYWR